MVGYRNGIYLLAHQFTERIRFSDGGISEPNGSRCVKLSRAYQVFRWWDIGRTRLSTGKEWVQSPCIVDFHRLLTRRFHLR